MRFLTIVILGVALLMGTPQLPAQQLGLEYDSEWQTDFRGTYNWANLLRLNASIDISPSVSVEASTISVASTNPSPIIDDLQGYSNIHEDNLPLNIFVLGAWYRNGRSAFFLGIRNVNEDYFTSPVTSLFVNSSCGIFPTLSGNYDIANYPLSSWAIHYRAEWDKVAVQTSLYDGLGHRRLAGHDNIFKFSPSRNGVFSITSVEYNNNGSNYSLGCAVYYGVYNNDEDGYELSASSPSSPSKKLSAAPWLNLEQQVAPQCSLMLQASVALGHYVDCRYYVGMGCDYRLGKTHLGAFANYAKYDACGELATELTCLIPVTSVLSIQPTVEVIRTGSRTHVVGIGRLSLSI